MEVIIYQGKEKLNALRSEAAGLFARCFGGDLDAKIWEQFYVHNPFGEPVGVTIYEDKRLAGFYGLAPQILESPDGSTLDYLLGMTLMIHPSYRSPGNFIQLMKAAEASARESAAAFILGFPNENSYLPLVRLCGWNLLSETGLFSWTVREDMTNRHDSEKVNLGDLPVQYTWCVPYGNREYMVWRSMVNQYRASVINKGTYVVYKIWDSEKLDVMDIIGTKDVSMKPGLLDSLAKANDCSSIHMTSRHASIIGFDGSIPAALDGGSLRMCALPLAGQVPPIHLSLLMADVY